MAAGLREIAFAEHADFEPRDDSFGFLRPAAYLEEIGCCRAVYGDVLTVRAGIEIGEPHLYAEEAAALLAAHRFDLVFGSLHWVEGELALLAGFFATQVLSPGLYLDHSGYVDGALTEPVRELAGSHGRALVELAAAVCASSAMRGLQPQV